MGISKYVTKEEYEDALLELEELSSSEYQDKEGRKCLDAILEIFGLEVED